MAQQNQLEQYQKYKQYKQDQKTLHEAITNTGLITDEVSYNLRFPRFRATLQYITVTINGDRFFLLKVLGTDEVYIQGVDFPQHHESYPMLQRSQKKPFNEVSQHLVNNYVSEVMEIFKKRGMRAIYLSPTEYAASKLEDHQIIKMKYDYNFFLCTGYLALTDIKYQLRGIKSYSGFPKISFTMYPLNSEIVVKYNLRD